MSFGLGITVKNHSSYWTECPINIRHILFDDTINWSNRQNSCISSGKPHSKRQVLIWCLKDMWQLKMYASIDEMYCFIKSKYSIIEYPSHYLSILKWIEANMKNGYLFDYYDIYCAISDYYREQKDFDSALEYDKKEFDIHGQMIELFHSVTGDDIVKVTDSMVYACTMYIYDNNDSFKFGESRRIQAMCSELGYLNIEPGRQSKLLLSYYWYRSEAEISYYKRNRLIMNDISDIVALENYEQKEYASTAYKKLADLYYQDKQYKIAVDYYQKSLSLWPNVYAAQTKMQRALKHLEK